MIKLIITTLLLSSSCVTSANSDELNRKAVSVAQDVNLHRYLGKWYAITSLPQVFTKNCVAQTADYALTNKNEIYVVNTCLKKNGKSSNIKGIATVVDAPNNAILEVKFNNFFTKLFNVKGDYIIFKLDKKYRYSLVGSRNLKSLWLLSRTKDVSEEVYNDYISTAEEIGFKVEKLVDSKFN